jgi:hypothetical protein
METFVFLNIMSNSKRFSTTLVRKLLLGSLITCGALIQAQAQSTDKVSVAFSDPSRPGVVKVSLVSGSISVKGYEGKEVVVEARARSGRESGRDGNMKRIPMFSTGLSVEEEDNQIQIGAASHQRPIDIDVTVPYRTSLTLRTVNDGDIVVNGVEGEFDVNDVNGSVTLTNVSGNAVAHALNGKVLVTFKSINTQKPMAFSSLNGDIDVTFPAELKANVSLSSERGEVFSDFDVQLQPRAPQQIVEDGRGKGGKYRVRLEKTIRGTINGGGQEIQFKNFNGGIYIRRAGTTAAR